MYRSLVPPIKNGVTAANDTNLTDSEDINAARKQYDHTENNNRDHSVIAETGHSQHLDTSNEIRVPTVVPIRDHNMDSNGNAINASCGNHVRIKTEASVREISGRKISGHNTGGNASSNRSSVHDLTDRNGLSRSNIKNHQYSLKQKTSKSVTIWENVPFLNYNKSKKRKKVSQFGKKV